MRHEDHVAAETVEPVDEGHQPLLEVEGLQLLPEPVQLQHSKVKYSTSTSTVQYSSPNLYSFSRLVSVEKLLVMVALGWTCRRGQMNSLKQFSPQLSTAPICKKNMF